VSTGGFDAEDARREALLAELKTAAEAAGVALADIAVEWAASHNGQPIKETSDFGGLELLRDDLIARKDAAA
jgi:aryl-alcohol dehydrogenase-like predicted oxidoreductase